MKFSRFLIWAAAVVVVCGLSGRVANADTVDPAIGIKQGGTGPTGSPVFGVEGFSHDCGGPETICSVTSDFLDNGTGAPIVALDFKFSVTQLTPISLVLAEIYQSSFTGFDLISNSEAILFAQNGESAIPPCANAGESCDGTQTLQIFVDNMNGSLSVTSVPAPVPEPATLALLGSGIGLMYLRRRRSKRTPLTNLLS
jgi:hypothetical protein